MRRTFVFVLAFLLVFSSLAFAGKPIVKIAFIGPLTGPAAFQGLGGRNAFKLAITEAKKQDLPFKLVPVILDDQSDPTVAVNAALKVCSDKRVLVSISHWNSPCALATIDTFHRYGLATIVWGAVHPGITQKGYKEVSRIPTPLTFQNKFAAKFLTNLGYKTFAVIYETSDYGKGHKDVFTKAVKELGGEIVSEDGIVAGERNFQPILTKIKAKNPDVVYYGGYSPEAALIVTQMKSVGLNAQFVGISGISDAKFIKLAKENAEGTIGFVDSPPMDKLPKGKEFMMKYKKAHFKEDIAPYSPHAYDATWIAIEALKRAYPELKRKRVVEEIRNTKDYDGVLGKISFDENGQSNIVTIVARVVQDGKWVLWEESEYAKGIRKLVPPKNK